MDSDKEYFVSLREHLETMLRSDVRLINARLDSIEKATVLAAQNEVRKVSDAQNRMFVEKQEFQKSISDLDSRGREHATLADVEYRFKVVDEKVDANTAFRNQMEGKATFAQVMWAAALGAAGLAIGLVGLLS